MHQKPSLTALKFSVLELERLYEAVTAQETEFPASPCCECGKVLELCTGRGTPEPGNFTLCSGCGCLNVFGEDMKLRKPTDEEIFEAAHNRDLQTLRRGLERFATFREARKP